VTIRRSVAGLLAAAFAWVGVAAHAVEVAPSGVGQVLLYPYYTVGDPGDGSFITLLTITNETPRVKSVRVRFREGRQGASVLEFNLYLAGRDAWVGALIADADGASLVTPDHSCTLPAISPWENEPTRLGVDPLTGIEVSPRSRTREGYVEVIEMGDYGPSAGAPADSIAASVALVNGTPVDCARIGTDVGTEASPPSGGLSGNAVLISVYAGIDVGHGAVALADFNSQRVLFTRPNTGRPTLADAAPAVSVIHEPALGTVRTSWTEPIDAVSAVLMRSAVTGDFVVDRATASKTAWVLTMPTKRHHAVSPTIVRPPFLLPPGGGLCQYFAGEYDDSVYDRETRSQRWSYGFGLPVPRRAICGAMATVDFNPPPTLFRSDNRYAWTNPADTRPPHVTTPSFEHGWMRLALHADTVVPASTPMTHSMTGGPTTIFRPDGTLETRTAVTLYGLPVIGFAAHTYSNGNLNGTLSNYAGSVPLRYEIRLE
jgi:hypothetical protein